MKLTQLQRYFRDLFIDELRVDEGWSEYIDLLVRHLSLGSFDYLQTGGMPYTLRLGDFAGLLGYDGGSLQGTPDDALQTAFCIVKRIDTAYILCFNAPRGGNDVAWFDYGTARITSTLQEVEYMDADNASQVRYIPTASFYTPKALSQVYEGGVGIYDELDLATSFWDASRGLMSPMSWDDLPWQESVELFDYSTGDQPCMLLMRVPYDVEESIGVSLKGYGGTTYPTDLRVAGIQLDSIPDTLNGSFILQSRQRSGAGTSLFGVNATQAGLFEILRGLGLPVSFRLYLAVGLQYGDTRVVYPDYVEVRQVMDALRGSGGLSPWPEVSWGYGRYPEVVGLVSAERVLVNPKYDSWGYDKNGVECLVASSSLNSKLREVYNRYGVSIFGYDKKLWVVCNNSRLEERVGLGSPYRATGSILVIDGDTDGDGVLQVEFDASGKAYGDDFTLKTYQDGGIKFAVLSDDEPWPTASGGLTTDLEFVTSADSSAYGTAGGFLIGLPVEDGARQTQTILTEESHPMESYEGITKDYRLTSLHDDGRPDTVIVSFNCSKSELAQILLDMGLIDSLDDVDDFIAWLEDLLRRSVPLGMDVSIMFTPTTSSIALGVSSVARGVDEQELYLLVDPLQVVVHSPKPLYHPIVVRSNVEWTVDMMASEGLLVRRKGTLSWTTNLETSFVGETLEIEVSSSGKFRVK